MGMSEFYGARDDAESIATIHRALDLGVTFLDTSDIYGPHTNEVLVGKAIAGRRDEVVLATKFGIVRDPDDPTKRGVDGRPEYVKARIEDSLRRLGVDHVDLYYYHQPDGVTPIAETLGAMQELVDEGKVRAIGCSQFTPDLLRESEQLARASGKPGFVAVQNEYSLLHREPEAEMLDLCLEHEIGFVPYFPLASGLLTGKYRRGVPPPRGSRLEDWRPPADKAGSPDRPAVLTDDAFDRIEALERWAVERGRTLVELAIGYLASHPAVPSVIAGATNPEQARANAAASEWQLSAAELEQVASRAEGPLSAGIA
jgi:aryl-alcohol dehydrogenase-like predicted oxidoreductase